MQGPQLLILVPSMELGVQEAMLIYKLFGGSVNPGIPGASANMFAYTGPRGLKVTRDEMLIRCEHSKLHVEVHSLSPVVRVSLHTLA